MKGQLFSLAYLLLVSGQALGVDGCQTALRDPEEISLVGEMRVKAIEGWDRLLTWALTPRSSKYIFASPPTTQTYVLGSPEVEKLAARYGYFSSYRPIVGIVTKEKRDVEVVNHLFASVASALEDPLHRQFAQDEILAKVLAYRDLEQGMQITLGDDIYTVDAVIDLWRGMPAYGLIPSSSSVPPILLYRGTDLNVVTEKGWASILSDLDINGPGHTTYLGARRAIRSWLTKMEQTPARVVGFSLGGVFALYSLIYDHDLITKRYFSVAFNPPGVSEEMVKKWEQIAEQERPPHIAYVNEGDFVSQIGRFLSNVWEVSTPEPMRVIESHVSLITAKPIFTLTKVDVCAENAQRKMMH